MQITIDSTCWTNAIISSTSKYDDNGDFYTGIWYGGIFHAKTWYSGTWKDGTWLGKYWLNGIWYGGSIEPDGLLTWPLSSKVSPKSFHKPKRTLSLNYATYI